MVHRVTQQVHKDVFKYAADLTANHIAMFFDSNDWRFFAQLSRQGWQGLKHPIQGLANMLSAQQSQRSSYRLMRFNQVMHARHVGRFELQQSIVNVLFVHHQVALDTATPSRPFTAQGNLVDLLVLGQQISD